MRIFVSKAFAKFAHKEGISDTTLLKVICDAEAGKIDADYGGNVIKQRIARPNEGKSGGYRSIILFRRGDKAFFVYGFAKSKRDNLDDYEVKTYKELAITTFALSEEDLTNLLEKQAYIEVKNND
jgi:hypothetical protein